MMPSNNAEHWRRTLTPSNDAEHWRRTLTPSRDEFHENARTDALNANVIKEFLKV